MQDTIGRRDKIPSPVTLSGSPCWGTGNSYKEEFLAVEGFFSYDIMFFSLALWNGKCALSYRSKPHTRRSYQLHVISH